jgi:hypothetical protein
MRKQVFDLAVGVAIVLVGPKTMTFVILIDDVAPQLDNLRALKTCARPSNAARSERTHGARHARAMSGSSRRGVSSIPKSTHGPA